MPVNDDRGAAMMLAVGVLMLVVMLGAVALANARSDVRQAERFVDRAEAGSLVDIAVAAAWGEIVDGAGSSFVRSGTTATGPWSVSATPLDDHRWSLDATGGEGTDATAAQVVVSREVRHVYTLLAHDITAGALRGNVRGRVGVTGDAVFRGRSMGTVQELIGPDALCVGCRNPVVVDAALDRTVAAAGPSPRPCPAVAGEITGRLDAGTYACTDPGPLVLAGSITADGSVVLDLGPDVALDLADATVNRHGTASDFVVIQREAGSATISAAGADLTGAVLAPTTPMTASVLTWRGTLDIASFTPGAGARLIGSWDDSLEGLGVSEWTIESWDVHAP